MKLHLLLVCICFTNPTFSQEEDEYAEIKDIFFPEDVEDISSESVEEDVVGRKFASTYKKREKYEDYEEYEDEDEDTSETFYPSCKDQNSCYHQGTEVVCGEAVRSGRIVNGTSTLVGAYPWAVGIQFGDKLYCGGSLITREFVLTAAHCLKGINHHKIRLVLGDHDREVKTSHETVRLIRDVFLRPDFEKKTFNNDIALIRLSTPVTFSAYIRPVCLPTKDRSYNGQDTIVVGWGKLREQGLPAKTLQEVIVPIIPQRKCRRNTKYRSKEITENMMCAGYDSGVLDACQGDSGGPMMWKSDVVDKITQIGIVSWGQGCARAGFPGVYTRLGRYLDWIKTIVEENGSCFCT